MDGKKNSNHNNDYEEGVVYESTRKISARDDSPPNKNRQTKNNMAAFYVITLVIAIVLCMIIFAIVFQSIANSKKTPSVTEPPDTVGKSIPMGDLTDCSGVIQAIDPSGAWIEILDVSKDTSYRLKIVKNLTKFLDKSGSPLLFKEFVLGEIVDVSYSSKTDEVDELSKSSEAWIIYERDNIKIDTLAKTITVNNDVYLYNNSLVTLNSNNQRLSLDQLLPMDVLTITGIEKLAWSVRLVKGHGLLFISNTSEIVNGMLEIDNDIYQQLGESNPIPLTEGPHHLVIKGDNIETFMTDVMITANQSEYVKLDSIPLKLGWLNIQVNTQDYQLFVDNVEKESGQPVNLPFGEHTIIVKKDGYITAEQTVIINELSSSINIELKPVLRLGKIIADSIPRGAKVYVDSAYVGDTPISVNIELGLHTVMMTKEGYNDISVPIDVVLDTEPYNSVTIELWPKVGITNNPFLPPVRQTEYPTYQPEESKAPFIPPSAWNTEGYEDYGDYLEHYFRDYFDH